MNREMSSAAQNRTDRGNCPVEGSNRQSVPQGVAAACLAAVGGNLSWVPAVKTEPRPTAMVRTLGGIQGIRARRTQSGADLSARSRNQTYSTPRRKRIPGSRPRC